MRRQRTERAIRNGGDVELRVAGLGVCYGDRVVLDAVSMRVRSGQVVAVTGPSGAGKTSLLLALAGTLSPRTGTITLDGSPVTGRDDAAARGVAMIPQGNALATVLTAAENVVVPMLASGVPAAVASSRARAALESVGLRQAGRQLVEELSGGQQQRVAVARGLALAGRVLLADEPTSELDSANRSRVMALLRAEAKQGAVVVLATHDPEMAGSCEGEIRLDAGVPTWARSLPWGGR